MLPYLEHFTLRSCCFRELEIDPGRAAPDSFRIKRVGVGQGKDFRLLSMMPSPRRAVDRQDGPLAFCGVEDPPAQ
jgi:hypothetical protein